MWYWSELSPMKGSGISGREERTILPPQPVIESSRGSITSSTRWSCQDHASLPSEGHPWAGTTRIIKRKEAHDEIAKLKERKGKEIVIWGSCTLWSDLIVHGLVDELHLIVGAAILGEGTRTFKDYAASIRRIETHAFDGSDNVLLRYEVLKAHA